MIDRPLQEINSMLCILVTFGFKFSYDYDNVVLFVHDCMDPQSGMNQWFLVYYVIMISMDVIKIN